MAIAVDVGGTDGIDPCRNITVRASVCGIAYGIGPCRNITVRTGGCGIADRIVPRRNIADTPQSKYVPIVHGAEIKGGARRPAEPQTKEPT